MSTLKKFFHLFLVLCFLTALPSFHYVWAQETINELPSDQKKSESTLKKVSLQNQPQITVDSTRYDAGTVDEGDSIIHTFTIKNTGAAQLNIKNVKAG